MGIERNLEHSRCDKLVGQPVGTKSVTGTERSLEQNQRDQLVGHSVGTKGNGYRKVRGAMSKYQQE